MDAELFNRVYETVARKESTYDGIYYTGVRTTGIVCRPSCRAKTPKPENVTFFPSVKAAVREGFRPCKRCRPETPGSHGPDAALAAEVDRLLAERLGRPLTLPILADELAVSPYHLQRVYKRVTGRSPAEQLQRVRLQEAKRLLGEGKLSMAEIGSAIGFRSASHMAQWFRRETGRTPTEYREGSLDSR